MTRALRSPRRSSAVLLLLLLVIATINVAAATTLEVSAGKLSAFDEPVVRCVPAIPVGRVDTSSQTVALVGYDVAPNCVGKTAQATVFGSGGSALGAGAGVVATPSFTLPLSPLVTKSAYMGRALAVDGLQIGSTGAETLHFLLDDWFYGYCATVTLGTTSPTTVSRSKSVAMTTYPLNGTVRPSTSGAVSHAGGVVTIAGALSETSPLTGHFCADRTEPPPAGDVTFVVTVTSSDISQYCADVVVSNDAATPVTWQIELDVSDYHPNGAFGGSVSAWSATTSYVSATSILTASGTGHTETIPVGGSVQWGYCARGLQLPPPDPGAEFDYTITIANHGGTSYGASVTVTTTSTSPITWQVPMDLSPYGVPASVSVANAVLDSYSPPTMTVKGAAWNKPQISSGDPVTFTYQASNVVPVLPGPADPGLTTIVSDQGGGGKDCRKITVGSTSPDWHPWQVTLSLPSFASAPVVSEGGIGSWDAGNKQLTVRGDQFEWPLKAGKTQQFKYCP